MEPSIMIGLPCLDWIKTETVFSFFQNASTIDYPAYIHFQKGVYVHDARNKIVKKFLESTASHLMFVDSDIQFPSDGINKLMKLDKDIAGGIYFRRQVPHLPTINRIKGKALEIPTDFPWNKPFQVDVLATGFMLIKRKVLEEIKPPYFYFRNFHDKPIGEDVYFCLKARERGIEIWCDPTIPLGHVGEYVYEKKDYMAYQDHIKAEVKKHGKIKDEFTGDL